MPGKAKSAKSKVKTGGKPKPKKTVKPAKKVAVVKPAKVKAADLKRQKMSKGICTEFGCENKIDKPRSKRFCEKHCKAEAAYMKAYMAKYRAERKAAKAKPAKIVKPAKKPRKQKAA